jgi:uncharacterized protein
VRREEVIARIRAHEAELRAMGVAHLALFGSVARGDDRPDSDVDVLIDVEPNRKFSLLNMAGVYRRLVDLLGRDVDLVSRKGLRARVAERISDDVTPVF